MLLFCEESSPLDVSISEEGATSPLTPFDRPSQLSYKGWGRASDFVYFERMLPRIRNLFPFLFPLPLEEIVGVEIAAAVPPYEFKANFAYDLDCALTVARENPAGLEFYVMHQRIAIGTMRRLARRRRRR